MSDSIEARKRWFEWYMQRLDEGVMQPPQPGVRYPCPCCGYPTLSERGGYEICALCNWEDDGQDDPYADEVWGGPNGQYSLSEARENFNRHLIMYGPEKGDSKLVEDQTHTEKQAKRAMMEAFDNMRSETDSSALNALWQRVYDNERILARELNRKIREHEKGSKC